jgi:predicted Rossmann fold flavoprotein
MVERHRIPYHERRWGQLFCDDSAQRIIDMLTKECVDAGAVFLLNHEIHSVAKEGESFRIETSQGVLTAASVVVATGGLSIPKIGATGIGYKIAEQFGLKVLPRAPALDGFVLTGETGQILDGFAGIALDVRMTCNGISFQENLLFTHLGLSGPVSLQVSLHWHAGDKVFINFVPQMDRAALLAWFEERKRSKQEIKNLITEFLPKRLAERFTELYLPAGVLLANLPKKDLEHFCEMLQNWDFVPQSTVGYGKAEVTRGGLDTNELSSKTMEARRVPGLYFIGEVVDVTGWLGGYNFQWAWASGWAAGQVV